MSDSIVKKLSLRIRVFLFFALIGVAAVLAFFAAGVLIARNFMPETVAPLVLYLGGAGFVLLGVTIWVWQKFDENVAQPILTIISDMQAAVHTGSTQKLEPGTGKYLGFLAPSVDQAISELSRAREGVSDEIQSAVEDADRLKRRLETVVRDLQDGVIICRTDHTILLYNRQAHLLLSLNGGNSTGPGLGRNLTSFLAGWPLQHSLDRLIMRFANKRHLAHPHGLMIPFSTVISDGKDMLNCRMSLMVDESSETPRGYVLTLSNVTEEFAAGVRRDRLLSESILELRRSLSNFMLAMETMQNVSNLPDNEKTELTASAQIEQENLNTYLDKLEDVASDLLAGAWPTSPIFSATLFECVKSRLESSNFDIAHIGESKWLECDSSSVVGLLSYLIEYLAESAMAKNFNLSVTANEAQSYINLEYEGKTVAFNNLEESLKAPIDKSLGAVSGFEVLTRYKSQIWPEKLNESKSRLRMTVSLASVTESDKTAQSPDLPARPEFYDFELFSQPVQTNLEDSLLNSLDLVVFDTETTGLNPSKGDEIISIAGVRVVNGRVLSGEYFNRLVKPPRKIPKASTEVHKITEDMVRNEETIEVVLPLFHEFVEGAVLVAHNAPFDMAFLEKNYAKSGVEFNQPVLDTVLLAAHAFGSSEDLTLDALMKRFSVELSEKDRHTALGDSLATGAVFVALIKILEQQGIQTLNDALEVSKKQMAIRRKQAKY